MWVCVILIYKSTFIHNTDKSTSVKESDGFAFGVGLFYRRLWIKQPPSLFPLSSLEG